MKYRFYNVISSIFFNYKLIDSHKNSLTTVVQYDLDGEQSEIDAVKAYGNCTVLEIKYSLNGESYIMIDTGGNVAKD